MASLPHGLFTKYSMLLNELYDDDLVEGPAWDRIKRYGAGAAVGGRGGMDRRLRHHLRAA